jgi:hypothetical protein
VNYALLLSLSFLFLLFESDSLLGAARDQVRDQVGTWHSELCFIYSVKDYALLYLFYFFLSFRIPAWGGCRVF